MLSVPLPESMVVRKSSQKVAWLIWIAHFAFITRQKIFERGRLDFDTLDAYAAADVLVVSILIIILLISNKTSQFLSNVYKLSAFWLLLYYLLCALSATWSLRPVYSFYRSIEFMVFFVSLVVALSYSAEFAKAEKRVLFLSLLSVFIQMGIYMKGGISFSLAAWHTNAYSASAAVIFVYCTGEYLALAKEKLSEDRSRRKMLFIYGCMSLSLLALGTSSGSNVAALIGLVIILLVQRKIGLMIVIIFASIPFFILSGGLDMFMQVIFPLKSEQAIETLGGRMMTWNYYYERIADSPLLGYGLGVTPTAGGWIWMTYSHNFVISILMGTGLLGLSIFFVFLIKLAAELIRALRSKIKGAMGIMAAMAAGFVNSLAMPMIADRWVTASFAFMSIFALFIIHVYPRSFQSPSLPSSELPKHS
jgi:O-antigen ligase